jgi:A/G-specific adenine glycosylase
VCTPRNPQCSVCPVQKLCIAFKNNRIEELPNLGKREPATARRFMALVIQHKGKFLVRQRPAGVVNAHLWEFPNMEVGAPPGGPRQVAARENLPRVTDPRSGAVAAAAKHILGFSVREISPLITIKHSITRYRITLEAFKATLGGRSPHLKTDAVWKTPAQLRHLAFTSAHRKVLHAMVEDF